jgi:L-amino acid N-acyltransferase YncA
MNYELRLAKYNDLEPIVEIYNQAILSRCQTGDTNILKVEDRIEWFNEHTPNKYPIIVAEVDNEIIGWISLSPYRKGREGLKYTIEVSYYVHNNYKRKGVGTIMMDFIIKKAKELKYKTLIAILIHDNIGSIKLLEKYHFNKWAFLPDILEIDGNIFSHLYYGLII